MDFIPSVTLRPDDVLIVQVAVGNMPPVATKAYLESVQPGIRKIFGDNQPMLFLAAPGAKETTFAVIHRP